MIDDETRATPTANTEECFRPCVFNKFSHLWQNKIVKM